MQIPKLASSQAHPLGFHKAHPAKRDRDPLVGGQNPRSQKQQADLETQLIKVDFEPRESKAPLVIQHASSQAHHKAAHPAKRDQEPPSDQNARSLSHADLETQLLKPDFEPRVIRSASDLRSLRDDPKYKDAIMLSQSISETRAHERDDREWTRYLHDKLARLEVISDKFSYAQKTKAKFFNGMVILARRVSTDFQHEPKFNDLIKLLDIIDKKNPVASESDKRLKIATLNTVSDIAMNDTFEPYMISKMIEIADEAENASDLINRLRIFESYLDKRENTVSKLYKTFLAFGVICGYIKKEVNLFIGSKSRDPVSDFENREQFKEKLKGLNKMISDLIEKL
ncbi:MAG: hypothetical protein NTY68_01655 [Candidatus Micrarchaeota archaeon]|nr:hypothetical protein [Candidatus Micrarchaeota archaeon]